MNKHLFSALSLFALSFSGITACTQEVDSNEQGIDGRKVKKENTCNNPENCINQNYTDQHASLKFYADVLSNSIPFPDGLPYPKADQSFALIAPQPSQDPVRSQDTVRSQTEETKTALKEKLALKTPKYRDDFYVENGHLISHMNTIIQAIDGSDKKNLCQSANAIVDLLQQMQKFEEHRAKGLSDIYLNINNIVAPIARSKTCSS